MYDADHCRRALVRLKRELARLLVLLTGEAADQASDCESPPDSRNNSMVKVMSNMTHW